MKRVRSPAYPSLPISEAIELVGKIYSSNRTNPIDREAAVKDMGYSGLTGRSGKLLATLLQYGLLEKSGKGGVRVTPRAVDILHPESAADRRRALRDAAFEPNLFLSLREKFPDGVPSENNLRSHLMREQFSDVAINPAVNAYLETCRFLQQENAYESYDAGGDADIGSSPSIGERAETSMKQLSPHVMNEDAASKPWGGHLGGDGEKLEAENERIVYREEGSPGQYLKLVASGPLDDYLLEAIEDFVKRQRKRLEKTSSTTEH